MRRYHAAWLVQVAGPPVKDGWALIDDGRVLAAGAAVAGDAWEHAAPRVISAASSFTRAAWEAAELVDLGAAALVPGLVNAHTHLELSWMRGKIPPAASMPEWVSALLALRAAEPHDASSSIAGAIAELREAGTAIVGDVSNTLASYLPLAASGTRSVVFHEVLGFRGTDALGLAREARRRVDRLPPAAGVRAALAPHAPYSVSPALFAALARERRSDRAGVSTVHLAESREEVAFLATGGGPWREILSRLGAWDETWRPPECAPVEYLDRLGWIDPSCLVVHGVQLTTPELDRLAAAGATLVTCPRSNRLTGAGVPPLGRFYGAGVKVAVGTDSLASCPDLSVFAEIHEMRRLAPDIPARTLLESATRIGAHALGFEDAGTITAGADADLVAVAVPDGLEDVEEYLVGGITSGDVRRVTEHVRTTC